MRRSSVCFLAAVALTVAAHAVQPPDPVWFVPWKVLNAKDDPPRAQLTVYWFPASRDDIRHSELLTSRTLTLFASQCVAMHVVRPDDLQRVSNLGASGKAPLVMLVDAAGREVARVESEHGAVRLSSVERTVRDAVQAREDAAEKLLDDAKVKCDAGEKDAAIAMYRRVCAERCLLPRQAKTAERALRRLGVDVE
jgi:hypothetical protein